MFQTIRECQSARRGLEAARRDHPDGRQFWRELSEGVASRQVDWRRFSVRNVFREFVQDGNALIPHFSPTSQGTDRVQLVEAGVDTGAFANITGQIVYSRTLDAFNDPAFIGPRLAQTIPTEFNGEKIPGIARLGDNAESVGEGEAFPTVGTSEEWIETPTTTKRGYIVPVTKEAIFFDRTGLVLQRAAEVATWLGVNKEKRLIDAAAGVTSLYRRNGAAAEATYQDSAAGHVFDNLSASTALQDYSDIETALLLFDAIPDPNTGEPIMLNPNQIMIPSALKMTLAAILTATEFRRVTNTNNTTISGNPLGASNFEVLSNQWVKARTSSASTWFIGDFMGAFAYMENWPITTAQAPPDSHLEFNNDIAAQYKVSERGTVAALEIRKVVKATA